ncbi:MAG: hypothetical protein ACOVS5_06875 [Oligoflexus sp.]|jgi:hypothetical protein
MREILPRVYQMGSRLFVPEQRLAYYLVRKFGNYLIYLAPSVEQHFEDLKRGGGVARVFLNNWAQVSPGIERIFKVFGATVVLPQPISERTPAAFPWECPMEARGLYSGLEVYGGRAFLPGECWYLLHLDEKKLLFCGDSLFLDDGHWRLDRKLRWEERKAILQILEEQDFDYLLPSRARGLISFQRMEEGIQEIEMRHLTPDRA